MKRPRWLQLPSRGRRIADDVSAEVRFHLEMRADELRARGMSPEDARREAARRFGDIHGAEAYCRMMDSRMARAERRRDWMGEIASDLRYAVRQMGRHRTFTLVAALVLSLGIGGTTAIYSVVHRLLVEPLPVPNGDRIVSLSRTGSGGLRLSATPELVDAWAAGVRSFERVVRIDQRDVMLSSGNERVRLETGAFEPSVSRWLHLRPVVGRFFVDDDAKPDAPAVVMLGQGLWQRRFGGARDIVGRTLTVDDEPYTVVGVAPRDLELPFFVGSLASKELFFPYRRPGNAQSEHAMAWLRPGATPEQAGREMTALMRSTPDPHGLNSSLDGVAMRPQDQMNPRTRDLLELLLAAVAVVLVIGCANLASLLLARGAARRRELAIRAALGAGRGRLVRQLLTESVLLSLVGGLAGLFVAWRALDAIIALRPDNLADLDRVRLDPVMLLGALAVSVLTGVLFGLAPALLATEKTADAQLRTRSTAHRRSQRFREGLVSLEIALSLVLLVGAGLLVRSLRELQRLDLGFDAAGLHAVRILLRADSGAPPSVMHATFDDIAERVRRIPGVAQVTVAGGLPGTSGISFGDLEVDGRSLAPSEVAKTLGFNVVEPEYFRLVGLRLLAGSGFTNVSSHEEAIINETMARRYWPRQSAVGKRFRLSPEAPWTTVIGVVENVRLPGNRGTAAELQQYARFDARFPQASIVFRASSVQPQLLSRLDSAALAVSPTARVGEVQTMTSILESRLTGPTFSMTLLSTFAATALLLAAVGLYGVVAYAVAQRTREMGIRMALGARPADVVRLVFGQSARLALVGTALGIAAAGAAVRFIESQLFGVRPLDPVTFVVVAGLLAVVALAATAIPARRATRVDPVVSLRSD
jgi:putative ABC transport system permease protein